MRFPVVVLPVLLFLGGCSASSDWSGGDTSDLSVRAWAALFGHAFVDWAAYVDSSSGTFDAALESMENGDSRQLEQVCSVDGPNDVTELARLAHASFARDLPEEIAADVRQAIDGWVGYATELCDLLDDVATTSSSSDLVLQVSRARSLRNGAIRALNDVGEVFREQGLVATEPAWRWWREHGDQYEEFRSLAWSLANDLTNSMAGVLDGDLQLRDRACRRWGDGGSATALTSEVSDAFEEAPIDLRAAGRSATQAVSRMSALMCDGDLDDHGDTPLVELLTEQTHAFTLASISISELLDASNVRR